MPLLKRALLFANPNDPPNAWDGVAQGKMSIAQIVRMPVFGRLFDQAKVRAAGGAEAFENLVEGTAAHEQVMTTAAASIFQTSVLLPCILVVVFGAVCLHDWRSRRNTGSPGMQAARGLR